MKIHENIEMLENVKIYSFKHKKKLKCKRTYL
jgi:hypothetical protein